MKRHFPFVIISSLIIVVYFLTRLYNIQTLPIFTDEAIYTRWAQIARHDANWRFISLVDGKQPLFIWFSMIVVRFVRDPLMAGRLVSVATGFFSMVGLFLLTQELFRNRNISVISSIWYLIYPMALVYDRIGLYDSLVATFAIWCLYLEVLLVRKIQLDISLLLGMIAGGGVLTKSNAFFSLALIPFSLLLFDFRQKKRIMVLLRWGVLSIISVCIAYGFYSILRLSPFFHIIGEKNEIFFSRVDDWINHPLREFTSNFRGLLDWFITYLTFPGVFLVALSFFINRKFSREKVLLVIWFAVPFFLLALFGKALYPRFIFFMTVSLLPLIAFSIYELFQKIKNRLLAGGIILLLTSFSIGTDYLILSNFSYAPIPKLDLDQYSNEWPAGGGIKEAVDFFQKEASKGKIFIATEGTFGLMPYSFEIYLNDNRNVKIFGFWPVNNPPVEMITASKKMSTYAVFYQPCPSCEFAGNAPDDWPLILIARYKKPRSNSSLSIYQVRNEKL